MASARIHEAIAKEINSSNVIENNGGILIEEVNGIKYYKIRKVLLKIL